MHQIPDTDASIWTIILRLGLATLYGGLLGFDRSRKHKNAGLRTLMLVALGSAALTLVSMEVAVRYSPPEGPRLDPMRTIAGIIGGIGFLGAGAIIQSRGSVRGMTTAATIWCTASVGVAVGAGMHDIALVLLAFSLFALVVMSRIKHKYLPSDDDEPHTDRKPTLPLESD